MSVCCTLIPESAELRYFEVPFDPDSDEVTPDLPVTSLRGVVCVTGGTVSLIPHTSDTKDWIAVKCADGSGTPGRELVLTTFVPSDGKALFRALTAIAAGESLSSLHTAWKVSFPLIFGAALVEDLPASGGNAPDSQGAVSGESPKTATTAASSKSLAAQVGPSSHWGPQSVKDLADLSGSVPAAAALALVFRRLWNLTQVLVVVGKVPPSLLVNNVISGDFRLQLCSSRTSPCLAHGYRKWQRCCVSTVAG